MTDHSFSHVLFWNQPLATLCYFSLGMSFLTLWVKKTPWLWGSFAFIAITLALHTGIASWMALIPIGILGLCHFFLRKTLPKGTRFLLFCIATALSCALIFHFLPDFKNWQLVSQLQISPDSVPYNLWLNFDKPWVGLFPLAFTIPLITAKASLWKVLKVGLPLSLLGILIMIGIVFNSGVVRWDPKIPVIFFIWFLANLIFVSIPEEAFFRGFVQREIGNWFQGNRWAGAGSVVITSLLFVLLHLNWVADLSFLAFVFVASILYGTIYQITQSIEASIFCHFGLNLVHFLLFSYPALQR